IGGSEILSSQIHHVSRAISFEVDTILHLSIWINVPCAVFRIEIICSPIVVPCLNQQVKVWILAHRAAKIISRSFIASIPRMDRAKKVIGQVRIKLQYVFSINLKSWSKSMVPAGQRWIKVITVSAFHAVKTLVSAIQTTDSHPLASTE